MVRGILKLFKPKHSRKTRPTFTEPSEAAPEEYQPAMFRTPKPSFRATVEDGSDEERMTLTSSMLDGANPYPTARRAAPTVPPPIQTVPSSQTRDRVTVISLPDQSYAGSLLTAGVYDRGHHMNEYGAPSVAPSVTSTRRDDQAHYRTRSRPQQESVAPPRSTASGEQYAASQVDDRGYAESEAPSLLRVPSGAVPLPGLHDRAHRSDSRAATSLAHPRHEDEYSRSHKGRTQHEYAAPPLSTASGEIYATQQQTNDAYARAPSAASGGYYAQPQASGSAYESGAPASAAPGEHYAKRQYATGDSAYARTAAPTTVSGEHYAQQYQMHDPPHARAGTATFPQPLPDSPGSRSPGSEGQTAYVYGATPSEMGGGVAAVASEPSTSWSRSAVFVPRPGSPVEVGGYRVRVEDPRPSSRSTHHRDAEYEYRDERPESRTSRRSGQSRRSRGDTQRYRDRDRSPSPDSRYHSRSREPCDCSSCRRRDRRDSGPRKPYVTFEGGKLVVHVEPGASVKVGNPVDGYLPVDEYNARQRARAAMAAQQPLYAMVPTGQVPGYPMQTQGAVIPQMIVPGATPLYTLSPVYPPPVARPVLPSVA